VNLEIARDLLEEMGCQVDVAEDGRAAVTATLRQRYDLVLMDCQMPEMDGFQATAEIREREADAGVRLPIVALTAHAMRGDRERCIAAGMDDYLSKPFEPEQLQNVLERWLPRAAQRGVQMTAGANGSAQTAAVAPSASALAASTPSTPVLDATALAKLRALQRPGKPSPMQKWGTMFLAGAPDHLRAMQEALERDDAETLQRSAHTLKSGAAQFGAHQFSQQCADIEALAKGGNVADARPKVATLHADYEPVRAALELELERDAADPPPRATSSPPVVVAARWSDLRKTGAKP
jgi:CheY-like chemotaxis protein/HPt (histidine-containing phosphotransfer) domain-containing protein